MCCVVWSDAALTAGYELCGHQHLGSLVALLARCRGGGRTRRALGPLLEG